MLRVLTAMACSCNSACMTIKCPCRASRHSCGSYCRCGHSHRACQNRANLDRCTCRGACMTMKCPCKKTAQFCTTNCNCGIGPTKECQNKQLELKKSGQSCIPTNPAIFQHPRSPVQVAGPFPAHHGDYGHSTKPLQHENSEEAWVIVDSQEIQHPIQSMPAGRTQGLDSEAAVSHLCASESVSNPKPKASFTPHGGYTTPEKPESVMEPQTKIPTPRWGCGITAVKAPYEPTKEPRKGDVPTQLWEKYKMNYHELWSQLEKHPEILQDDRVLYSVRSVMEGSPIVDFGCIQDLIFTMKQMAGESLLKQQEEWKSFLWAKAGKAVQQAKAQMQGSSVDLGVEIKHLYTFQRKTAVPSYHEEVKGKILQTADVLKKFMKYLFNILSCKKVCEVKNLFISKG